MFENYLRKLGARQYHRTKKYDVALEYFFDFSLHLLEQLSTRPDWSKDFLMLSDEETLNYRNYWVAKEGITQGSFGIMFYSRIELESTNFTNHHIDNKTTNKILSTSALKPFVHSDNPELIEVRNYLRNLL
tara:strand:- start:61 stop:453 length:393 start_codon:yes stop_codon:yes gene_type:complete